MPAREPWLVVPVKPPQGSKQRLAGALPDPQRRLLSAAMSRRALRIAAEVWPRGRVVVVTADPELGSLCAELGLTAIPDPGSGQTAAVRLGVHHCLERGAAAVATLAADLPRLDGTDMAALLEAARRSRPGSVVQVPDLEGEGSNGLVVNPASILVYGFGQGSRQRHRLRATSLGLSWSELRRPGLAADLDRPADLARIGGAEAVLGPGGGGG